MVSGRCLGGPTVKWRTYVHHLHTFLHTSSGLCNPLQHTRCVSRPHILSTTFLQHSTTVYSLQFYSISTVYNLYNTPLTQEPSAFGLRARSLRTMFRAPHASRAPARGASSRLCAQPRLLLAAALHRLAIDGNCCWRQQMVIHRAFACADHVPMLCGQLVLAPIDSRSTACQRIVLIHRCGEINLLGS